MYIPSPLISDSTKPVETLKPIVGTKYQQTDSCHELRMFITIPPSLRINAASPRNAQYSSIYLWALNTALKVFFVTAGGGVCILFLYYW